MYKRILSGICLFTIIFILFQQFIMPYANDILATENFEEFAGLRTLITIFPLIWLSVGFGSITLWVFHYSSSPISRYSNWTEFGEKLKLAYAAKFGGPNKGFNEEVDSHVSMMNHLRAGFTKALAKDWMLRMEKFTEADTGDIETEFEGESNENIEGR